MVTHFGPRAAEVTALIVASPSGDGFGEVSMLRLAASADGLVERAPPNALLADPSSPESRIDRRANEQ